MGQAYIISLLISLLSLYIIIIIEDTVTAVTIIFVYANYHYQFYRFYHCYPLSFIVTITGIIVPPIRYSLLAEGAERDFSTEGASVGAGEGGH